eukprot:gb/GFBE01049780.1/.p1 GENE.gb/GFBE01049780.1/~~gb/GFBE01049780.1/.p1  ORF type:complete len:430 (+),score=91.29 gb/GFBE01049780.1/:1-1290(+)
MAGASDASSQGSIGRRSMSISSSECKFEKALRLAEARMARDARNPAAKVEHDLRSRELKAQQEAREAARQEWLEGFSTERATEHEERMNVVRSRRDIAQSFIQLQQEERIALGDAKARAEEARAEALAQLRADEEALNREIAASRDTRIVSNVARATALQQSRAEAKRRQQEDLARRRAQVEMALARERAESAERRRARAEESGARLRTRSQQIEDRRREKEERFQQKIEQVQAEQQRRQEIMEQIKQLQRQQKTKADQLREMAWQAAVTNKDDDYRQEVQDLTLEHRVEAAFPRLSSAPTTPRSPRSSFTPSNRGGSPRCSPTARSMSQDPRPAPKPLRLRMPTDPVQPASARALLQVPHAAQGDPISPASRFTPCSSHSSIVAGAPVVSPLRRKLGGGGRSGPVASSLSLGSTRCSLQASAAELDAA